MYINFMCLVQYINELYCKSYDEVLQGNFLGYSVLLIYCYNFLILCLVYNKKYCCM